MSKRNRRDMSRELKSRDVAEVRKVVMSWYVLVSYRWRSSVSLGLLVLVVLEDTSCDSHWHSQLKLDSCWASGIPQIPASYAARLTMMFRGALRAQSSIYTLLNDAKEKTVLHRGSGSAVRMPFAGRNSTTGPLLRLTCISQAVLVPWE